MTTTHAPRNSSDPGAGAESAMPAITSLTAPASHAGAGVGDLEVVVPDLGSTVRWFQHGYPSPLARWHHHPEIEFHLIRSGSGQLLAGDQAISFRAGHVSLMGPNLPHNWLSDLGPQEVLPSRDVLCQVHPQRLAEAATHMPELISVQELAHRARRGVILSGPSAEHAARVLVGMEQQSRLRRMASLLELVDIFLQAPPGQWHPIVAEGYVPSLDDETTHRVNTVLDYIEHNLDGEVSMTQAARLVAMSSSAFSRFFRATAGLTFSDLVRRRRIARACHLLRSTDLPVSRVSTMSGYTNLANFNRRFRTETGTTPTAYRRGASLPEGAASP
ncbi:AraC family transcriptional regulator [Actinomyces sp. 2119]|uniref:helix-turn-helix domain-containing protein n=1 Tax=Actinomyces sp. 2119 TaxID=2321393 RepID=UPI001C721101|nr:AraC family transcriptional regulator [Actinomyces sp. 2119]